MKEYKKLIVLASIASITILGIVLINTFYKAGFFEREKKPVTIVTTTETALKETTTKVNRIVIEIKGEVCHPGVYVFNKDEVLMIDAIHMAGGLTPRADSSSINNLTVLDNHSVIVVGSKDSPSYLIGEGETLSKININTCTIDELKTLDSIGDARANAILEYRKKNGFFLSVDDILKVDGISIGILEKIKDYITV